MTPNVTPRPVAGTESRSTSDLSFGDPDRGEALDRSVKRLLEDCFDVGLDHIRVHVGPQASRRNVAAFAHGTDLYFAPGCYRPEREDGLKLLGHELVHVLQQSAPDPLSRSGSHSLLWIDSAAETEAEAIGALLPERPSLARAWLAQRFGEIGDLRPDAVRWDRLQPNVHVEVNGQDIKLTDVDVAMNLIANGITDGEVGPAFRKLQHKVRPILHEWIKASRRLVKRFVAGRHEHTVRYRSWDSLARALLGEVRSSGNRDIEKYLALCTQESAYINGVLTDYLSFVNQCLGDGKYTRVRSTIYPTIGWYSKEYSHWYPSGGIKKILTSPGRCEFKEKIAGVHDIVAAFGKYSDDYDTVPNDRCIASALVPNTVRGYKTVKQSMLAPGNNLTFRVGSLSSHDCTLIEDNEIIRSYRDANIPVGFGPSFTTGRTVQCCYKLCGDNQKAGKAIEWVNAIAWGLFAFWNLHYERRYSRCHTFHEAMDMASNYGVPYTPFKYPLVVPSMADPYPPGEEY